MIVINISNMFSLLILTVAKLVTNVTQCAQIMLIKPHETRSNSNPDDVFNSLDELKIETIHQATMSLTQEQLYHYFITFNAALEAVRLIEIGQGIIQGEVGPLAPSSVICGPLNFTAANEISSLQTPAAWWTTAIPEPGEGMSAKSEQSSEFPDAWIQYPIFSSVVLANALTVLSSSIILTKFLSVRELSSDDHIVNVEVTIKNAARVITVPFPKNSFDGCIKSFNIVEPQEKAKLCSRFIQAHGRFWPYVESFSTQAETIITYINDIASRI
jgi:hypothetical protein